MLPQVIQRRILLMRICARSIRTNVDVGREIYPSYNVPYVSLCMDPIGEAYKRVDMFSTTIL